MTLEQQVDQMGHGDHVCLIYESFEEQAAALVPFIRTGLLRGERCVYIVDENTAEEVADLLRAAGIAVADEVARGALVFSTTRDSYLRSGEFDPEAMIDFLREAEARALADGFTGLRVTGEMTWALGPEPGCERVMEYEALLNRYFPGSHALATCQYNRERFPAEVIEEVLQTHPIAILGEAVVRNPYFEPPDGFLNGWTAEQRVGWKLEQLRRSHFVSQELVRAKEAAEAADKAKAQFLAVMSHELRTPLNAAVGYTHLLEAGVAGPLSEQQAAYISRIDASTKLLGQLVEEILSFARIEAGAERLKTEPTDLREVVRTAVELLEPLAAEKGLGLHLRLPPGPIELETDAGKLEQIVLNLAGNAIKFTERGGVEVRASAEGESVVLEVRDEGPGIAPEHRAKIFEPFWQVDQSHTRAAGGSGLGLAVSRRLVELLGGEIELESEPGQGSTFRVRLPRRPAAGSTGKGVRSAAPLTESGVGP